MIVPADETNLLAAATVHAVSWRDSHRSFCSPTFVALHTPERQREYLRKKMDGGSRIYLLIEDAPVGVVSVTGSLVEDLYVLPDRRNRGCGTALLQFAIRQCTDTPTLWILENNKNAERLYRRLGFRETGKIHAVPNGLAEIEFSQT
ncbi:MAG: GNAT family N-acetyltransferase [Clostridia bacterium]|nr:GNAT family N-acetyltransferase [Clostridia bacterium]